MISKATGVGVDLVPTEGGHRAAFSGVQVCGSVWACPCCSSAISETRRGELNALLAWARAQGLRPIMLTLTTRHGLGDDLGELLGRLKDAKQRFHRHRAWTALKPLVAGSVTATEVTYGRAGWHPHLHMIVLVRAADQSEAVALGEGLQGAWLASLRGAGLDGTGAGYSVQGAAEAGRYIGKWGAGEELALGGIKTGRKGGRTPAQLLADAVDEGDRAAGALWRTYAEAFHGRRQLVWSRGLKSAAGIGEVSDEEAAREGEGDHRREIARIEHDAWAGRDGARRRRGRILGAAEAEGASGVARVVAEGGDDPGPEREDPLIEVEASPEQWTPATPRPGGLAARALAGIRRDTGTAPPV